ncbi:unnamed protein product [Timema podura]|uniref:Uncharacterized protein n=1 Tax=Timema podura TaxID=61482 RepID=A0ABN7PJ15_TIMPD|nr:unnamed protein product [Timema podura]
MYTYSSEVSGGNTLGNFLQSDPATSDYSPRAHTFGRTVAVSKAAHFVLSCEEKQHNITVDQQVTCSSLVTG